MSALGALPISNSLLVADCHPVWYPAAGSKIPDNTTIPHHPNHTNYITNNIVAMVVQVDANGATPPFVGMPSTQKGRAAEKVRNNARFDEFAQLQGKHALDAYTFDSVQERDANGKLLLEQTFEEYATFVKQLTYKVGNTDKLHGPGSLLKIFSTPYDILANKFKELNMFRVKDLMNSWWVKQYGVFKFQTRVACIARGEELEENTTPISYEELCTIGQELLGKGTGSDIEAYVAIAFQRQACGRPGETGLLNFTNCEWKDGLEGVWGNHKEGQQQRMTFYPDNRGFMLDPYHAFGCLKLVKPGYHICPETKDWFFLKLTDYAEGGIAGFLSRKIKEVSSDDRHTAHGVRAGAADDMLLRNDSMDRIGVYIGAVYRAGWLSEVDCTIFRYLFTELYIAQAGKTLAGYEHPEQDVATPSLDCLPDEDRPKLENLAVYQFGDTFSPRLEKCRDCVLASLLMYHDDVVRKFGSNHAVARTLEENCIMHGISKIDMKRMGGLIASDLVHRNEANLHHVLARKSHVDSEEQLLEAKRLESLTKENAELKTEVKEIRNKMKEIKDMLGQVLAGIAKLTTSEKTTVPVSAADASPLIVVTPTPKARPLTPTAPSPANANDTLMKKARNPSRHIGQWIIEPKKLQETPVSQFLIDMHLRSVKTNSPAPFGSNVDKRLKSRIKKLHETALDSAMKSCDPGLTSAAKELKSLSPIDASAGNYQLVVGELRRMAGLVCSNLERELCDAFSSSIYLESKVAAGKAIKTKELEKLRAGFGPSGGCGTVVSFIEKKASMWTQPWMPPKSKKSK